MRASVSQKPQFTIEKMDDERVIVSVSGVWTVHEDPPSPDKLLAQLKDYSPFSKVIVKGDRLNKWDSLFVLLLSSIKDYAQKIGAEFEVDSVPQGALHILTLAEKGKATNRTPTKGESLSFFARIGEYSSQVASSIKGFHAFLGEVIIGLFNILTGKSKLQFGDFLLHLQNAGAMALPIVSLVSFLVGLILAFVATVQLKIFGAQIFVADLVGIAMARDMGAMMVGIIMAGRTGATYAAQLGTMQVNEEIDALKTLGLRPVEFLVIPRILALSLMMVPLCVYSDLLGIAGGAVVGAGLSDVTLLQYISETQKAVPLTHFFIGMTKCFIYGIIVALVGCRKGLSCGRSAASVGKVTTSAVVTSIVWIIVACAIVTIICYVYEI